MSEPEVLSEVQGCAGIATLNRPKALNALNTNMVRELLRLYGTWASDSSVHCVLLRGSGGKAFCAGGDIKAVVQRAQEGDPHDAAQFFLAEYQTNYAIQQLPKPHVALIDGITMGGGVGVSVHGPIRVATERTVFAMPECGIGLFPDVGGSWCLPRLPHALGPYLALTGARLQGAEVKQAGVATHYVDSALLPQLVQRICSLGAAAGNTATLGNVISEFEAHHASAPTETALSAHLPDIEAVFAASSLEGIYASLRARGGEWAAATLKMLQRGSPLSQHVTWRQLVVGAGLPSLRECLVMEARLAYHMLTLPSDFAEGVRALLLDRDNAPRWRHGSIEEVPASEVEAFFAPLEPSVELQLPQPRGSGSGSQARL